MGTYLTIMVGPRPEQARPVLASSDAAVVGAALRAIMGRLGGAGLLEGVDREGAEQTRLDAADDRDD